VGRRNGYKTLTGVVRSAVDMKKCLLIGFGNTLRRDDGLGPYVVDGLATENLRGMEIAKISIPQIDLILASGLSRVDVALFVDARVDDSDEPVIVEHCSASEDASPFGSSSHSLSIPDLLRLTRDLYGHKPESYVVMPKGFDFSLGDSLTPEAEHTAALASRALLGLVGQLI
jgi:hydrogenase maturation protease